jgi:hypothetical protein
MSNQFGAGMDGSYPMLLQRNLNPHMGTLDFFSCSGDELDDIDGQLNKLAGTKADVVSLSVSGNDFLFGKAVVSELFPPALSSNSSIN